MDVDILSRGAFGSALVQLQPGETFVSESGAMYRASSNIDIDVTTRSRGKGGILAGVKRLLGGEHFYLSTYRVTNGGPGEVGLAPALQGEVREVLVDNDIAWFCAGGSYLGSEASLALDTRFQGAKGLFTGESLFFLRVAGDGRLLVNAFGRITEMQVDGGLLVDTGHLVGFQESLSYSIRKAGRSLVHSFLAGEGLVMHFEGQGKILVQSHDPAGFGSRLGPLLPPRQG